MKLMDSLDLIEHEFPFCCRNFCELNVNMLRSGHVCWIFCSAGNSNMAFGVEIGSDQFV